MKPSAPIQAKTKQKLQKADYQPDYESGGEKDRSPREAKTKTKIDPYLQTQPVAKA
jgi:hypothetical protein